MWSTQNMRSSPLLIHVTTWMLHIVNAQSPRVTSGYHIEQHRSPGWLFSPVRASTNEKNRVPAPALLTAVTELRARGMSGSHLKMRDQTTSQVSFCFGHSGNVSQHWRPNLSGVLGCKRKKPTQVNLCNARKKAGGFLEGSQEFTKPVRGWPASLRRQTLRS